MKHIVFILAIFSSIIVHAKQPASIIFVIGDGMGPTYTSAYRYFADNPKTTGVEPTIFDELLSGMARTYPADETLVTDSAAAATALASGVKTYNGAIGVDLQQQPLLTILEAAKAQGYRTAMISTSSVTHATPASFAAHVNSRQSHDVIADQYFDQRVGNKLKVDLILGGGQKFFVRADRNLIGEFEQEGYSFITELDQLESLQKLPAMGLFADDGLPAALDSENPLTLTNMTTKALSLLDKKPFFLLVEASQIDWCGHANDIACAMAEMRDLAETLSVLKAYVDRRPNTILVATADHGTGGLSIGAMSQYQWDVATIKKVRATAPRIAERLIANEHNWQSEWFVLTAIELKTAEIQGIQQLITKAKELAQQDAHKSMREIVKNGLVTLVLGIINERTHTGWTTSGHTGEDVQIFSYGKGSQSFIGNLNNTDIALRLFSYLPNTTLHPGYKER